MGEGRWRGDRGEGREKEKGRENTMSGKGKRKGERDQ